MASLWKTKPLKTLLEEAEESEKGLKKHLSATALVALGIGAIIGAGLFSVTGIAAANYAGPGIMLSFVIAAIGCAFAGLCYAEFSSMIPVAGSAYTYSYATMGEYIAWIIGWDLVLEYAVGSAAVASSWAGYFAKLLNSFNVYVPERLMITPFELTSAGEAGIMNLPAVFIVLVISLVLIKGIGESAKINMLIVLMKISIVLIFIALGINYVKPENLSPLIPKAEGSVWEMKYGWAGVIRAAGVVFFAYIGFDAVSTAAQEAKNPKKAMPIGILGSLALCTALYIAFAYVLVGVVKYTEFNAAGSSLAPVAIAVEHMGSVVNGKIIPEYPWLNSLIIIAILIGYISVILVMLLGQSRVFYSMSKDGLLPKAFSDIHSKFRTPYKTNIFFLILISLFAAFVPGSVVGEMTSIGTLFAFILVCIGILVMRKTHPEIPRTFKTPFVPFVPVLGVIICFIMMAFLPFDTWIRLVVWMMVGLDIYLFRGIRNSFLGKKDGSNLDPKNYRFVALTGLVMTFILIILNVLHHQNVNSDDWGLVIFSVIMVVIHTVYYSWNWWKNGR